MSLELAFESVHSGVEDEEPIPNPLALGRASEEPPGEEGLVTSLADTFEHGRAPSQ